MALGKVMLETAEAASGGILLNIFNKLVESGDKEKIGQVRQAIVRSGILPFSWTSEDEAKLMARFGKLEEGLSVDETSTLSEFLAKKCTPKERTAFRCSLALIKEVTRIVKNTTDDKATKKTQTTEKEEVIRDDGLGFLKKLADPSLNDKKRYTICKGLGLFDFYDFQLSAKLADAAKKVRKTKKGLEKKYGPLTPAAPASVGPIGKFFNWLDRVFPV